VVLSTDIAESSLTVSGVRIVVDAGLARVPRHDLGSGMTRLTTISTSRASADQRAGRAGRTEPGVAYRLWSKLEHATRRAHLEAEITQVDLAGVALELAAWGTPVVDLRFIDPPPARAMQQAQELLRSLGAIDAGGVPTPTGRSMLSLPVHPRLARMVADAPAESRGLACVIAAILDERDVLRGRADELPADLGLRVRIVCGHDHHERADRRDVARVRDRAVDIARRADVHIDFDSIVSDHSGAVLALAFPDRVAIRRRQPGQFQMRSGTGAWVPATDPLANEDFVIAADVDGNRSSARVRIGAAISAAELIASLGDNIRPGARAHVGQAARRPRCPRNDAARVDAARRAVPPGTSGRGHRRGASSIECGTTRLGVLNWTAGGRTVAAAHRLRIHASRGRLAASSTTRPCWRLSTSGWRRSSSRQPTEPIWRRSTWRWC
jgi:ATP-dependent helicase HrpB